MGTKNHTGNFIFLMVIFFCCLLLGCNDSDSDSDKSRSIDTENTWYRDSDGDGYGDPSVSVTQKDQPAGYVSDDSDCADYDADIFPGALEICDGKDNNCDGKVDENACDPDSQKISGRIVNISGIRAYINDDSYLQLVFYPVDGQPVFSMDARGRRIYTSDLARVDMPDGGLFLFETTGLISGEYIVAAQALTPYAPESGAVPILADEDDQTVIFSVSADNAQVLDMDLGNVRLPVPEVAVDEETGPDAPSGVSASDGDFEDKIRVIWNSSPEADSYEVFRADSFAGQKIRVKTTTATVYEDRSLPCGVDYYYWVKAVNAFGASDLFYSDLGFICCPAALEPDTDVPLDGNDTDSPKEPEDKPVILNTPAGISASDGTYVNKIRITWKAVSGAAAYDVYRCETCCGAKIKIGSSSTLAYDDLDVNHGDYYYWVKANDASGTSEFSLPDIGYIMIRPLVPTGVKASDGTYYSKILVTWDPALKPSIYDFDPCCPCCPVGSLKICTTNSWEIYRARWSGDKKILIGTSTTNQFFDTDVECSNCCCIESYTYWVKAVNAVGTSSFSNEDKGSVYRTLCDPTGVKASDGRKNCVWVVWNTVAGAMKYDIYRSDSENGEKIKICSVDNPCNSFRDTTTTCPTVYYYWVKTVDAKGYTSCTFGRFDTGFCAAE